MQTNNTGQPTAIDIRASASRQTGSSWTIAAVIWSVVLVSFRPFQTEVGSEISSNGSGDFVNQFGFGLLGVFCIWVLSTKVDASALSAFKRPTLLLGGLVLLLSVLNADEPSDAFRSMIFSLIVVICAVTAMAVLGSMNDFTKTLVASSVATLAFCYVAVTLFPAQGIHGADGYEAQHAGLWRGIYDHKNVASYIMGSLSMIGLFLLRVGRPVTGFLIFLCAIIFTVQAGSKTALGILPAALATAAIARWVTPRFLRALVVVTPIFLLFSVTLGSVLYPPVLEALRSYVPGLSYTGRTDLWIFGLQHLSEVPFWGYGYDSFWATPRVAGLEQPIELNWDVRGIVHGHNSWLDTMLAFGIPGALVLFWIIVAMPIRDYLSIPDHGNAARLATLFIAIFVFSALAACLESFFLRRADPVWFLMLVSIVGLRVTAHMSCVARATTER